MIFKFLKLIFLFLLIIIVSTFLSKTKGNTRIDWLGWGIEIETSYFVMINILLVLVIVLIDRLWRFIINIPKNAIYNREKKKREKVETNLVRAFLLASHGEYKQASKEALLISNITTNRKLGSLLKEHSEALNQEFMSKNKEKTNFLSNKYIQALSEDKNTSYIADLAKIKIELGNGKNWEKINEYSYSAYQLEPNSEQIVKLYFYSSIKLNKIKEAIDISNNTILKKLYGDHKYKKILSSLYYLEGVNNLDKNKNFSEKFFKLSIDNFKGNILSVLNYVDLIDGINKKRKSIKLLRECFYMSPHGKLLNKLLDIEGITVPGEKVAYAIKLLEKNNIEKNLLNEIKIQVAKLSIIEKIWGEAKNILNTLEEKDHTKISCQLLAEIASSENKSNEVSKFLKRAAKSNSAFSYYCLSCGKDNKDWYLSCLNCNELSTVEWSCEPKNLDKNKTLMSN